MITERDDDYLICKEYMERIDQISTEYPDFITFQHPNGNHYFAWVHDGQIILRSEAYPDEERMIRGIKAILKNRDIIERYSVDTQHGVSFLVLWGGGDHQKHTGNMESHNEIGRSCPKKSREEIHGMLLFKGKDFADAIVPLDAASTAAPLAAAAAAAAVAASAATSYTATDKVAEKTTARAEPAAVAAESGGSGFKWWYLLPLLLIPFLWKMCKKEAPATDVSMTQAADTVQQAATVDTIKSATSAPAQAAATPATPDCNLNWILFDFDKYDIRPDASAELKTMADILKSNPEYVGDLNAFTDAKGSNEYNDALSANRAKAAKAALVAMGIDAARLTTSASSESAPIATNTEDDSGRKYNRRVELRVKDKSGKEICKSIPPAVPAELKTN